MPIKESVATETASHTTQKTRGEILPDFMAILQELIAEKTPDAF